MFLSQTTRLRKDQSGIATSQKESMMNIIQTFLKKTPISLAAQKIFGILSAINIRVKMNRRRIIDIKSDIDKTTPNKKPSNGSLTLHKNINVKNKKPLAFKSYKKSKKIRGS